MEKQTLLQKTEEKLRVRVREGATETEIQEIQNQRRQMRSD
jgi:hypothetical protein